MPEALVPATKAGAEPELVYQASRGGLAGSAVLDAKVPLVMARNFNPGFRLELHFEELINTLETAHQIGVPLPFTAGVMEIMQSLKVEGRQGPDHGGLTSIIKNWPRLRFQDQSRSALRVPVKRLFNLWVRQCSGLLLIRVGNSTQMRR